METLFKKLIAVEKALEGTNLIYANSVHWALQETGEMEGDEKLYEIVCLESYLPVCDPMPEYYCLDYLSGMIDGEELEFFLSKHLDIRSAHEQSNFKSACIIKNYKAREDQKEEDELFYSLLPCGQVTSQDVQEAQERLDDMMYS
jgi:hypothetical protein